MLFPIFWAHLSNPPSELPSSNQLWFLWENHSWYVEVFISIGLELCVVAVLDLFREFFHCCSWVLDWFGMVMRRWKQREGEAPRRTACGSGSPVNSAVDKPEDVDTKLQASHWLCVFISSVIIHVQRAERKLVSQPAVCCEEVFVSPTVFDTDPSQ